MFVRDFIFGVEGMKTKGSPDEEGLLTTRNKCLTTLLSNPLK